MDLIPKCSIVTVLQLGVTCPFRVARRSDGSPGPWMLIRGDRFEYLDGYAPAAGISIPSKDILGDWAVWTPDQSPPKDI